MSRELESVCAGFNSLVLNTVSIKAKIQYFLVNLQPSQWLLSSVKLWEENGDRLQDWTERQREREQSANQISQKLVVIMCLSWCEDDCCCCCCCCCCCWCLQEIKLDSSWQPYKMYRDSGPHHQTVLPSNLIWKCLFSHFNTKELISSSLSEL